MREFTSEGSYQVNTAKHGTITVWNTRTPETFEKDSRWLIDETVLLDGRQVKVCGIEAWCLKTIREGALIGLWVEEMA